jgi:hypothetical protein
MRDGQVIPSRVHIPEAISNSWAIARERVVAIQHHTEINELTVAITHGDGCRMPKITQVRL